MHLHLFQSESRESETVRRSACSAHGVRELAKPGKRESRYRDAAWNSAQP